MSAGSEPVDRSGLDPMYRPPDNRGGENREQVTLEDVLQRFRGGMPRIPGLGGGGLSLIIFLGIAAIAVIWAATGFFTVDPDEQAALRMFGRFDSTAGSGLHWWWPAPIGKKDVVLTSETRRMELGFRGGQGVATAPVVWVVPSPISGVSSSFALSSMSRPTSP